jgi:hypothetical protein
VAVAPTAGDVLVASGIDVDRVRAALPRVDPSGVPVRPAPRWLRLVWGKGIVAFTAPWAIYVHPATLGVGLDRIGGLIVHELVHAEQWRRLGWIRQAAGYVGAYLKGRLKGMRHGAAYRAIPQEVEAREVAAGLMGQSPR